MHKSESRVRPWQKYIDDESPQNVPILRKRGYSVWSVVGYYRLYRGDGDRVLAAYDGGLSIEELDAALAYYWANADCIDSKLEEISGESIGAYAYGRLDDASPLAVGEQSWRKYIDEESRSVALIRDKGWSIWSLVRNYRIHKGDKERVLSAYLGDLSAEELNAALAYYWANPFHIDQKLKALSAY